MSERHVIRRSGRGSKDENETSRRWIMLTTASAPRREQVRYERAVEPCTHH